jgi:hypothetical protein
MNAAPNDSGPRGAATRAGALTEADRALVLARCAWPAESGPAASARAERGAPIALPTNTWDRLEPSWRRRLLEASDASPEAERCINAALALAQLKRLHHATARVDFARVHPSWWARALKEESPAVSRLVAASAPDLVRGRVSDALLLDKDDLARDHPVNPEVLSWTLALWSERLVGGDPESPDDPPAIVVLSRLVPRAGYRVCRHAGLAKLALAAEERLSEPHRGLTPERFDWFRDRLAAAGGEILAQTRADLTSSAGSRVPSRHYPAWLGAVTLARLLADCEPFRLRWALQHWPYPLAKMLRTLMPPASNRSATLSQGDALILKTAWDRLKLEKRLPWGWPISPGIGDDGSDAT